ncbi:MerR family transcriptional regulator [Sphingomicrobium arenosum]|uniref:MerR family transcriptional regulator n=1 Tax=Sphingomicrobium arenosum TaxID=2233861 RepID=UPI00223EFF91|nr:MerR family DNA-binding transcriptional regulator [Sphingomicrobium arenosum]
MSASHADSSADTGARYSIGQMCEEFGVTARALRFYEDERLIAPQRVGTQRLYSERDRARVAWILRGKRVGFSLAEIGELLDLYDLGDQRRTQRQVTLDRCQERIEALTRQKADIDETIEELEGFVRLLQDNSED